MCRMLEDALEKLGIAVRQERMPEEATIAGGLCAVRGRLAVIVSRSASSTERAEVFTNALRQIDTEAIWLPPAIRDLIEEKEKLEIRRRAKGV
jgi:hypothetical protein